jgi:hypothetical protein
MEIDARPFVPLTPMHRLLKLHRERIERPDEATSEGDVSTDWDAIRDRLADRWPVLTADELEATHGRGDLVAALLQAKLAYAQRLADESMGRPVHLARTSKPGDIRGWRSMIGLSALTTFGLFFGVVLFS